MARDRITILIEVGDGSDEFQLKLAKKLDPPRVFKEYAAVFASPTLGRWSEFAPPSHVNPSKSRPTTTVACLPFHPK